MFRILHLSRRLLLQAIQPHPYIHFPSQTRCPLFIPIIAYLLTPSSPLVIHMQRLPLRPFYLQHLDQLSRQVAFSCFPYLTGIVPARRTHRLRVQDPLPPISRFMPRRRNLHIRVANSDAYICIVPTHNMWQPSPLQLSSSSNIRSILHVYSCVTFLGIIFESPKLCSGRLSIRTFPSLIIVSVS